MGKANPEPVVRLVADTAAHAVACREALRCAADAALLPARASGLVRSRSCSSPPQDCPSVTRAFPSSVSSCPRHDWLVWTGTIAKAITDTQAQFAKATEDYLYESAEIFHGGIRLS